VTIANTLQLEGRTTSRRSFWANFDQIFVLRMRTNCYIRASDQHSGIAIKFSDANFLKERNNLAIRRRFQAVPCPSTLLTESLHRMMLHVHVCNKFEQIRTCWVRYWSFSKFYSRRYVTLWSQPLTVWPWTFVIDRVSRVQTL